MINTHALNTIIKKPLTQDTVTRARLQTGEVSADKPGKRVTDRPTQRVTENQLAILDTITKDGHITAKKLSELISISERDQGKQPYWLLTQSAVAKSPCFVFVGPAS